MKYDGVLSEYYRNEMGLMQGVVVSPLLFALYINDFEINFVTMHENNCLSIELQMIDILISINVCWWYMVIIAELDPVWVSEHVEYTLCLY